MRWILPVNYRHWLALSLSCNLIFATPPVQAVPLLELLMQGAQLYQYSHLSDAQEVALGQQMNRQVLTQQSRPYADSQIQAYVNQVGQQVARASNRPNIPYHFTVVTDPQINAFATMGGYVHITSGLLKAADNEVQVAGVLGHEIGHINRKHLLQQMQQTALTQGVTSLLGMGNSSLVNMGTNLAFTLPNSRQDEFEADTLGLGFAQRAGYAPQGLLQFLQKLVSQSSPPSFLSTHPAAPERITALQSQLGNTTSTQLQYAKPGLTPYTGQGLDNASYAAQIKRRIR